MLSFRPRCAAHIRGVSCWLLRASMSARPPSKASQMALWPSIKSTDTPCAGDRVAKQTTKRKNKSHCDILWQTFVHVTHVLCIHLQWSPNAALWGHRIQTNPPGATDQRSRDLERKGDAKLWRIVKPWNRETAWSRAFHTSSHLSVWRDDSKACKQIPSKGIWKIVHEILPWSTCRTLDSCPWKAAFRLNGLLWLQIMWPCLALYSCNFEAVMSFVLITNTIKAFEHPIPKSVELNSCNSFVQMLALPLDAKQVCWHLSEGLGNLLPFKSDLSTSRRSKILFVVSAHPA